jgi:DnaJ-class molecular chaperone with C-terminal Zn finger domain
MTNHSKTSAKIEKNLYQVLDVPNTSNLAEIRQAYEVKLEETHLEAFAGYSLLPEEETEEKLLQFSHAYITLANPIARAKYDDELNQPKIPDKKKSDLPEVRAKNAKESTTKIPEKNKSEEKAKISKKEAQVIAGQTLKERQDNYLKLSAKNEHTEDNIQEFYNTLKTGGREITYNRAVLQQIRKMKSLIRK